MSDRVCHASKPPLEKCRVMTFLPLCGGNICTPEAKIPSQRTSYLPDEDMRAWVEEEETRVIVENGIET